MVSLKEIQTEVNKIKGIKNNYPQHMSSFYNGSVSRNSRDKYKVQLGFNAKELIKDECKGIPIKMSDYKMIPIILFVELEEGK